MTSNILVLHGSTRAQGNTAYLTERLLHDIPHTSIVLAEKEIRPIVDQRHTPEGFAPVPDDYDAVISAVLTHELLVFATPIYWYGMSGPMKDFFDRWSQSLRDSRYAFKAEMGKKKAYVVLTGGDQPRFKGLPLIQQFQYAFDFVGMQFADYLIGEGNRPGSIAADARALAEADCLNRKLRALL